VPVGGGGEGKVALSEWDSRAGDGRGHFGFAASSILTIYVVVLDGNGAKRVSESAPAFLDLFVAGWHIGKRELFAAQSALFSFPSRGEQ